MILLYASLWFVGSLCFAIATLLVMLVVVRNDIKLGKRNVLDYVYPVAVIVGTVVSVINNLDDGAYGWLYSSGHWSCQ